jgi:nicotinamidase-related amidase
VPSANAQTCATGWNDMQIFVSGDLHEGRIEALLRDGACVDSFGVGTTLSTSADAPSVGVIYKNWPPHCLKGSPGAELIAEGRALNRLVIPNQSGFPIPGDPTVYQQVILEKNTLDVFDNPNTDVLLKAIEPCRFACPRPRRRVRGFRRGDRIQCSPYG